MAHLLRYPSEIPMRSINKETEAVELDQLFESYVETDLFQQLTTSVADPSGSDDLAHLFDLSSSNGNELFGFTPILHRDSEPWHKATQLGSQNPAFSSDSLGSSVNYSLSRGKSTSSDSDTLSFEDLFELERNQLRSISQPPTPRPTTATSSSASSSSKCIKKAQSFPDRAVSRGVQKSLKKCPSSSFAKTAKMMQPSYYRTPVPHMWARKMDSAVDLHAHVLPINMHSPPPSSKFGQDECADGFFAQHHHQQPYTTTRSPIVESGSSPDMGFSNYQLTPQASPAIGVHNNSDPFSQNIGMAFSSAASNAALAAYTPPSSVRIPMSTWGPTDSPAMDFPYSTCSSDFATTKTAGWWNDESMPIAQQSYPTQHRESHARSTSQTGPLSMAGLGISCDMSSFSDMSEYQSQPDMASYHQAIYPAAPLHQAHPHPENLVPIGTRPLSRSPSPTPQPRFHRRRPSGQAPRASATAGRRKSSHSLHGSSRTPSTASAAANVGFVNFTPDDSRKILTGVAPSGSSKTKARREKEAADKRRKLSQAAVKAVMEAGGDVERLKMLEREGLCVFEG
ncbi:hypothetical protein C7974DRAFT_178179 [Boeremia exigua]|uniref:uncharacterized protein n=1 Tax=Boeremia exigua TaxID=749465 RepID=UPI001E8D6CE6|nr:uncharacterized protein C7974DRAFT_178179 [Boeremia exigua]KAH6633794.1 hypothetical protein C7974DRAFT_178179 [Boeremia exigua]